MPKTTGIKAIIIDDEQNCIDNLCYYLSKYCTELEVVGTASDPAEVQHLFEVYKPDVAFLDIELGNDNIFSILNTQQLATKIVFVTAYEKYAIKAIKAEALDYVLKPLSKEEILLCYRKILRHFLNTDTPGIKTTANENTPDALRKVILRQGEHVFIVKQTDIYYFHAKGFYTEVFFDFKGAVLSTLLSKPLSILEKEYDASIFFRLHKSYLINTNKVEDIIKGNATTVKLTNDHLIPVAKRRVSDFLVFLNK